MCIVSIAASFKPKAISNKPNKLTGGIIVFVVKLCTIMNIPNNNKITPIYRFVRYSILPYPKG